MWYYIRNNRRAGPVDNAAMPSLIVAGAVARDTLVWKEGMNDWQPASTTELGLRFANIPPAVPIVSPATSYVPASKSYAPESFRTLWLWFAWLVGAGVPLCLLCIGIPAAIAGFVIGYVLLYRYWALIQDGSARTTPGKAVGFCFIPFFNFYWLYVAWVGLAKDMNLYCRERNIPARRIDEGLALTWFVLALCGIIPYLGILTGIACLVILIILQKQYSEVAASITVARQQ